MESREASWVGVNYVSHLEISKNSEKLSWTGSSEKNWTHYSIV